jgi:hypothetical protein
MCIFIREGTLHQETDLNKQKVAKKFEICAVKLQINSNKLSYACTEHHVRT